MGSGRSGGARRERTGGVVIWKPTGMTTRAALEEAERRLGIRSLGHTGTLDPLASGIVLLVGGQTRKFQDLLTRHDKEYEARIVLGVCSDSEDAEGPLWCPAPRSALPDPSCLEAILAGFVGTHPQVPPRLSALRIDGARAHERTRRGEVVTMAPRWVKIERVTLLAYEPPRVELSVVCGAGTYLRALARDLGERLGTGAFLAGLRRVRLGAFSEAEAVPLASLGEPAWRASEALLGGLARVDVDSRTAERLAHGQRVTVQSRSDSLPPHATESEPQGSDPPERLESSLAVVWHEERVRGIVEVRGGTLHPRRWLRDEGSDDAAGSGLSA